MNISTPTFEHEAVIPAKFTCEGDGINPLLELHDVPREAKSLALIMDDPDSPTGTWVHWTMWNIDPATIEIAEGEVPHGAVQGQTSFGVPGYGGPCPGKGSHRYFFKLYALDTLLDIPITSDKAALEAAMQGHVIGQAELMGTYIKTGQ